jgi:hypothetical protein
MNRTGIFTVAQVIEAATARLTLRKIYCWIHDRFRKLKRNGYHFSLTPGQALELLIVAELRRKGIPPGVIRRWQLAPPPEADCLVVFCAKPRYAWLGRERAIKQATKAKSGVLLVSVADLRTRLGGEPPAAKRRTVAVPPHYRRSKVMAVAAAS